VFVGSRIALALGWTKISLSEKRAHVRQRCVGEFIGTPNCRLSILLLIAVFGAWPITANCGFANYGSHDVRDIGVNRFER